MGLDSVELILSVEEAFGIRIADEDAARLFTVGDLHAHVVQEIQRQGKPAMPPGIVYDLLRNLICMELGVRPEEVVPGARFVQDLHMD